MSHYAFLIDIKWVDDIDNGEVIPLDVWILNFDLLIQHNLNVSRLFLKLLLVSC